MIQARTGFVVPERFIDQNGKVRPEEATAAWLLSPNGKRALDAIEQGLNLVAGSVARVGRLFAG